MTDPAAISQMLLTQIAASTATQTVQPNAQVLEVPPEFQTLQTAQIIIAEVIRQNADNSLLLKSDTGNLSLATSLIFDPGNVLSIRLEAGTPPENAVIKLLRDVIQIPPDQNIIRGTLSQTLTLSDILGFGTLPVTPLPQSATTFIIEPFAHVEKFFLTPQSSLPFIASLEPMEHLPLYTLPQEQSSPAFHVKLPDIDTKVPLRSAAAALPLHAPITADFKGAAVAPLQISVTQASAEALTIINSISPSSLLLSDARAGQIHAMLIGLTPEQHFPVFQTLSSEQPQLFALQAHAPSLPIGTQITLDVLQTQSVFPLGIRLPPPENISAWPIMQEVQETLAQTAPQAAQVFQAALPNISTPMQIAPAVLFFIMAVRGTDASGWLGDKVVDTLKRAGKSDLIGRLEGVFSSLSREVGDWRVMALPLAWNNDIYKLNVSYKKEDEHDRDGKQTGTKTRFIIDLNLSALGKVQLDALYSGSMRRLDLILRTQGDFNAPARQEMRTLYKNALDETGITGELSFSGTAEGWVKITDDTKPEFQQDV